MWQVHAPNLAQRSRVTIPGIDAPIEVRRHPAARRLTLRVSRTRRTVIVTLPIQCDLEEAGSFLHRNIRWVRERLESLPVPVPFADGALVPLRGHQSRIVFGGACRGGGVVREMPGRAFPELHVSGEPSYAPRRFADWLVEEARRDLEASVETHVRKVGLKARRVSVKDQSSRWGSCSASGVLSFSWRLVLAPPAILDYVAAHEVAHLAEMNHGPRFWSLVKRIYPGLDDARRWLHVYGMELHRYGS